MEKLTQQEELIMKIIWRLNGGFVRDLINELGNDMMPYTTVASVVQNLKKKGYVNQQKVSNSIFYRPTISMEEFRKQSFSEIFRDYFMGSPKELVASFIQDENISPKELKEIINLIEKGK